MKNCLRKQKWVLKVKVKILIVEDNKDLRENISYELELRGYDTVEAQHGIAALDYLTANQPLPDLILCDVKMPRLGGFGLFERLQAQPEWSQIPFIFLTGNDEPASMRSGLEMGADDYITKPFQMDDLEAVINSKIRKAKQWRNYAEAQSAQARQDLLQVIAADFQRVLHDIESQQESEDILSELRHIPNEFARAAMRILNSETRRLSHLVAQISFLAKVDSGHDFFKTETIGQVKLKNSVEVLAQVVAGDLPRAQARFHFDFEPAELSVIGCRSVIETALREVLHNAVNFAPRGETARIEGRLIEEGALLIVQDAGSGVPRHVLQAMGERFLKGDQPQAGYGLGLAVAKTAIELHGGSLRLHNMPQGGARAEILLAHGP